MKNFYYLFILAFVLCIVYILYNFICSFLILSPSISRIFDKLDDLENNQELIDSTLNLRQMSSNDSVLSINLNSADTLIFHFVDSKTDYEYNGKKNNFFIASEHFKNADKIFYLDKDSVPLKYKIISNPYSIKVFKGKVIKSSFNYFNNE